MDASQIAVIIAQVLDLIGIIFGVDSQVVQIVLAIVATLTALIGSASVIVAALAKIAAITPNTKDDFYVGKAKRYISLIASVLDRLALNPDKDKARQTKR
jgi:hypothetical protein